MVPLCNSGFPLISRFRTLETTVKGPTVTPFCCDVRMIFQYGGSQCVDLPLSAGRSYFVCGMNTPMLDTRRRIELRLENDDLNQVVAKTASK